MKVAPSNNAPVRWTSSTFGVKPLHVSIGRWVRCGLILAFLMSLESVEAQGQTSSSIGLQDGDRPSILGVAGGAAVWGLAFSASAGLAGLALTGGDTDCYEGGCATLLMVAAAWPLGSAFGATRAVRGQGYEVGFGRILAYSVLGTGLGTAAAFAVDGFGGGGRGPPDWAYGAAPLAVHFLTVALLSHWTISFHSRARTASFLPIVFDGQVGLAGLIQVR